MKVLFADRVHDVLQNDLEASGFTCLNYEGASYESILAIASEIDGLIIRSRFPVDKAFLDHCHNLMFIGRSGAGMENIDVPYCEQKGIVLFNAPEGNRDAVGEHAVGMILSLFNKIHTANQEVKNGIWLREENRGIELGTKTVGIIGFGNNGSAFAKKLSGFGCRIVAYDKYKTGYGNEFVVEAPLEEIFNECDVISFHIPQNEETLFMADDHFFKQFRKPIHVINLARGKIIKTSALVKGLEDGSILGACLDVLEFEKSSFENMFDNASMPDDFSYLLHSNKVLLSPHVGGWTTESYYKLSKVLADKILIWHRKNQ